MNTFKTWPAALLALTLLLTPVAHAGGLEVEDAWIAEAPPVSKVLAAYMQIENETGRPVKIVSASSKDFGNIEFHRTVEDQGMARMLRQKELLIAAGGQLNLAPGGYHMMLFRPSRPLRAGDKSTLRLELASGDAIEVVAEVRKAAAGDSHEHHHHNH